jgi:hypothetical protein
MSCFFEVRGHTVWNPALRVAEIYVAYVRCLEEIYGKPSGLGPIISDTVEIEADVFLEFIRHLMTAMTSSNHMILELELRPVIIPALVMLERAGASAGLPGIEPLRSEIQTHARAMPDEP